MVGEHRVGEKQIATDRASEGMNGPRRRSRRASERRPHQDVGSAVSVLLQAARQEPPQSLALRRRQHLARGRPAPRPSPRWRNTRWFATSRANPISCVTTTIVRPSAARSRITLQHFADEFGVERRGRLVEQHHLGLHRERPRDRDALLLAARELRRVQVLAVRDAHPREQRLGVGRSASIARHAEHADRRLDDVLEAPSCATTG